MEWHVLFLTLKLFNMVKRSSDEPDDKALERLRQFEAQRKAVPDTKKEDEEKDDDDKKKPGKKDKEKKKGNDAPDKATDQL
jgi:hypothetical protein